MKALLAAALALAALASPTLAFAHTNLGDDDGVDVRGVVLGLDAGYSLPRGHEYGGALEPGFNTLHGYAGYRFSNTFELEGSFVDIVSDIKGSSTQARTRVYAVDGRFFIPVANLMQANFLLGYAPVADLNVGNSTEHGHSFNLGAGARIGLVRHVFLTADFRHMFIRHDQDRKGDIGLLLVGAGYQF